RALSQNFGGARQARMRLLREVDILLACDDTELAALANIAQARRVRAGTQLLRAGEQAAGLWIIEAGEVLASQGTTVRQELHRGSALGGEELVEGRQADLSYRTSVDTELLFIPAAELADLIREAAPHAANAHDSVETMRLLERVHMFAQLPRATLRLLTLAADVRQYAPRDVIIRQGVPSGQFFVIKQGHAAVIARSDQANGTSPLRVVARLGPEEFFGELELVDGSPPRANVVAETALLALAIPHEAVRALALGDNAAANSLAQVSSGRMLALREP
ncbi:MAG: cyclic nucleotide-binding domain-containing protein, partial [Roseiflexaceae bacterium]|nr:cyclic nucleotide-binding domain-containing protein [Roseiflexaceae bacterium]